MASVDYFLKVKDIDGESEADKHKNSIQVESWSWGETNSGTGHAGGGSGAGKVSMQDFHFVMRVNKASPKLNLACASGLHIPDALLTCRRAGKDQQEYLKYKFSDVMVSSYQTGGSAGDIVPMDQISLNFAKIEVEYYPQKADGSLETTPVKFGWDLKKEKKI